MYAVSLGVSVVAQAQVYEVQGLAIKRDDKCIPAAWLIYMPLSGSKHI